MKKKYRFDSDEWYPVYCNPELITEETQFVWDVAELTDEELERFNKAIVEFKEVQQMISERV